MKYCSTTSTVSIKSLAAKSTIIAAAVLMVASGPISMGSVVSAQDYESQMRALREQQKGLEAGAEESAELAETTEEQAARLLADEKVEEGNLAKAEEQLGKTREEIEEVQKNIEFTKDMLGELLNDIAIDDAENDIIKILASDNVADIIDAQENRKSMTSEADRTRKELEDSKKELKSKEEKEEREVAEIDNRRARVAAKRAERQALAREYRGKEAEYKKMAKEKNAEIQELRRQQAAELARRAQNYGGSYTALPGDPNRGGYPAKWANAPMNAYVDTWGMYSRQCVSYVAFKVQQAYGNMPYWGGVGNANQWPGNARRAGIPTGTTPKVGSVGVVTPGTYGHVAWVESVNSDGTINISHYNVGWGGEYAYWANLDPSYFDTYIYFGEW